MRDTLSQLLFLHNVKQNEKNIQALIGKTDTACKQFNCSWPICNVLTHFTQYYCILIILDYNSKHFFKKITYLTAIKLLNFSRLLKINNLIAVKYVAAIT